MIRIFSKLGFLFGLIFSSTNLWANLYDKDYEGLAFITDTVQACHSILESHSLTDLLSPVFENHLVEALQRAVESASTSPGTKESRKFLQILQLDASELLKNAPLSLSQWNIFYLRLALFYEFQQGHNVGYFKNHDKYHVRNLFAQCPTFFKAIWSQRNTLSLVLDKKHCNLHPSLDLLINPSLDSCFIATDHALGMGTLNYAFTHGVYPAGVLSKDSFEDGVLYSPIEFLMHDLAHALADKRGRESQYVPRKTSIFQSRMTDQQFFSTRVATLSEGTKNQVEFIYFLLTHDGVFYSVGGYQYLSIRDKAEFLSSPVCSPQFSLGAIDNPFPEIDLRSKISDTVKNLGKVLPTFIIDQVPQPWEVPEESLEVEKTPALIKVHPVIESYFLEAKKTFCEIWSDFLWPDKE